ncbi:tetratricopeptide repeat-containing sensor histidine kinase [Tenacibaculum agarivorans]|uniref:tetratricopeptide repeat-containing sensor histidine kinase n=1 Tax=Tenacibaculum agarivorans TaxID=1908389 RepID=UPI001F185EE6|nr:ATP-binding protein [Tenacibaculum agarivorans]
MEQKVPESTEVKDYGHFFRGYGFLKKGLLSESENEFYKISKDFEFALRVIMYQGEINLMSSKYEKAIEKFKILEDKPLDLGFKRSNILFNLGLCYLHLKKFKRANKYLKKSLKLYEEKKDTTELVGAYAYLGSLYYEQYKDDIAIPYFQRAYDLAKNVDDFTLKRDAAKNMAIVEENRKDLVAALLYRKEYEQWKDSLNDQNKIWQTAQFEKKFAIAQKEKEVNVLKAENRAQVAERNTILYAAIGLFLLLIVISFFYRKNIKSKKTISLQNEKLDALNTTKDRLFSIVSHDLRSSVNTLKLSNKKLLANLEAENFDGVHQLLLKNSALVGGAYNLLDNLLNWALLQTKQAYFEIKELQLFFAVEHVAFNYLPLIKEKEIHFENKVPKSVKALADKESLKIILRNILDNAIKFSESNDSIKIYTQEAKEDRINIVIEDTGLGMDEETRLRLLRAKVSTVNERKHKNIIGSGLGLQLCKSMIQKNKGEFLIESELGRGTKMIVSLPKSPD